MEPLVARFDVGGGVPTRSTPNSGDANLIRESAIETKQISLTRKFGNQGGYLVERA